jgi:hypothetical protein
MVDVLALVGTSQYLSVPYSPVIVVCVPQHHEQQLTADGSPGIHLLVCRR